eukprot:1156370-Pelagomonas_calceolata.AAC.4
MHSATLGVSHTSAQFLKRSYATRNGCPAASPACVCPQAVQQGWAPGPTALPTALAPACYYHRSVRHHPCGAAAVTVGAEGSGAAAPGFAARPSCCSCCCACLCCCPAHHHLPPPLQRSVCLQGLALVQILQPSCCCSCFPAGDSVPAQGWGNWPLGRPEYLSGRGCGFGVGGGV